MDYNDWVKAWTSIKVLLIGYSAGIALAALLLGEIPGLRTLAGGTLTRAMQHVTLEQRADSLRGSLDVARQLGLGLRLGHDAIAVTADHRQHAVREVAVLVGELLQRRAGCLDQLLLGDLGAEIAIVGRPVGSDDG